MFGTLYLDTARLGPMVPTARQASLDFVRLTAEEPSSLYFEEFLRHGFSAWPEHYQNRFPGLASWQGVGDLKKSITRAFALPSDRRVLLANRSAELMKLAAKALFRRCRNILVSDINWSSYQKLLAHEAERTGNVITTVPLHSRIFDDQVSWNEVAQIIKRHYLAEQCDGLFLPAVSHTGVRLPIREIADAIREDSDLRYCVVDAAQAFAHVPEAGYNNCDLIIAGCHKWLGAYQPLGIAVCPQASTQRPIRQTRAQMVQSHQLQDPLLRFTEQLASRRLDGVSETTNIAPLFSCSGALQELSHDETHLESRLEFQKQLANRISHIAANSGWLPIKPPAEMQTGILLLKHIDQQSPLTAEQMRARFEQHRVIFTCYGKDLIRLSMPTKTLSDTELAQLQASLELSPVCNPLTT